MNTNNFKSRVDAIEYARINNLIIVTPSSEYETGKPVTPEGFMKVDDWKHCWFATYDELLHDYDMMIYFYQSEKDRFISLFKMPDISPKPDTYQ